MRRPARILLTAATIVLVLACAGCQDGVYRAYDGPARPEGGIARLARDPADRRPLDDRPRLIAVDGRGVWPEWVDVLELTPGPHELAYKFHWSNRYNERFTLAFTAAAGQTYRLEFAERTPDKSFAVDLLEGSLWRGGRHDLPLLFPLAFVPAGGRPKGHSAWVRVKTGTGDVVVAWESGAK